MRRARSAIKAVLGLALGLLVAGTACAAPPTPLLWKATRGDTTIYLLGSLHILLPGDYPLSHDIDEAYRAADKVVFEVPPADMNPLAALGPTTALGMYADPSHSLKDDLDPATWQRVVEYGEHNGLPESALSRMRPWLVSLAILAKETEKLSYDPNKGLDMYLMGQVMADHKQSAGFETIRQQLQIMSDTRQADQVHDLRQMLDDIAHFRPKMTALHDAWRSGDAAGLYRQEMEEFKDEPDAKRRLIDDRNRAWVPELERMTGTSHGTTLVVVGALHLLGANGLVQMLKHDGYRVERVCTGCTNVH